MRKPGVRPLDILIILSLIAVSVFLTVRASAGQKGARVLVNANGTNYEYSAAKDGVFTVQGEQGPTTFEIKNGRVRITDSPCPNKTCISQGWHNPLVCLPNKVIITVQSEDEFDAISE